MGKMLVSIYGVLNYFIFLCPLSVPPDSLAIF